MPDEQDELEQAWQALSDRERLLNQTVARRSAEIDARARRFDEIGADLDARRQLIEDAEEELVERERRLTLAESRFETGASEIERAAAEADRVRDARVSSTARRASCVCSARSWRNGVTGSRRRLLRWRRRSGARRR